ncbi:hypothetical protein ACOSHH_004962 [Klebsiella aerogenes]
MNFNSPKVLISIALVIFIQGCTETSTTSQVSPDTVVSSSQIQSGSNAKAQEGGERLQICLFEAEQLSSIREGKYSEKKVLLYEAIREAKFYESISSRISVGSAESLTPYYQFKISDICNDISRTIYDELKAGVKQRPV